MNRFLYFMPNVFGIPNQKSAAAAGLGYAFPSGCPMAGIDGADGPEGMLGVIAVHGGDGRRVGFRKKEQIWRKISATAWVGIERDPKLQPGPADLQRGRGLVEGHALHLGAGVWTVPTVCCFPEGTNLPFTMRLVDGRLESSLRADHQELHARASAIRQAQRDGRDLIVSPQEQYWLAANALAVNYRVTAVELALLGALTRETIPLIVDAAIDGPSLLKMLEAHRGRRSDLRQPV